MAANQLILTNYHFGGGWKYRNYPSRRAIVWGHRILRIQYSQLCGRSDAREDATSQAKKLQDRSRSSTESRCISFKGLHVHGDSWRQQTSPSPQDIPANALGSEKFQQSLKSLRSRSLVTRLRCQYPPSFCDVHLLMLYDLFSVLGSDS